MEDTPDIDRPQRVRRSDGARLSFVALDPAVFSRKEVYAVDGTDEQVKIAPLGSIIMTVVQAVIACGILSFLILSRRWSNEVVDWTIVTIIWSASAWIVGSESLALWRHPLKED